MTYILLHFRVIIIVFTFGNHSFKFQIIDIYKYFLIFFVFPIYTNVLNNLIYISPIYNYTLSHNYLQTFIFYTTHNYLHNKIRKLLYKLQYHNIYIFTRIVVIFWTHTTLSSINFLISFIKIYLPI